MEKIPSIYPILIFSFLPTKERFLVGSCISKLWSSSLHSKDAFSFYQSSPIYNASKFLFKKKCPLKEFFSGFFTSPKYCCAVSHEKVEIFDSNPKNHWNCFIPDISDMYFICMNDHLMIFLNHCTDKLTFYPFIFETKRLLLSSYSFSDEDFFTFSRNYIHFCNNRHFFEIQRNGTTLKRLDLHSFHSETKSLPFLFQPGSGVYAGHVNDKFLILICQDAEKRSNWFYFIHPHSLELIKEYSIDHPKLGSEIEIFMGDQIFMIRDSYTYIVFDTNTQNELAVFENLTWKANAHSAMYQNYILRKHYYESQLRVYCLIH